MFPFNKIVDDRCRGAQTSDIGVKIITANFDLVSTASESEFKLLSSRENNVIINIAREIDYLQEIENVLKIDAFLRVKSGTKSTKAIEDIKNKKSREREERLKRAKFLIEEALKTGEIYANGSLLDIREKIGIDRINEGLRAIIDSKYNKINYIKSFIDNGKDLYGIMDSKSHKVSLGGTDSNILSI